MNIKITNRNHGKVTDDKSPKNLFFLFFLNNVWFLLNNNRKDKSSVIRKIRKFFLIIRL